MEKPIHQFFSKDHRRIDKLLDQATEDPNNIDLGLYEQFRVGLLTHIKMEENVLFPAAKKANGGKPMPDFKRFRLEHAALTTLLAVPPNSKILKVLQHVLEKHDEAEEQPGGMYDVCEKLTNDQTDQVIEQAKKVTEVPVHPPNPAPEVLNATKRVLKRAGYDFDELAE